LLLLSCSAPIASSSQLAVFYAKSTGLHCKSVDLRYAPDRKAYTSKHLVPSPLTSAMYQRTSTLDLPVRAGEHLVVEAACHRPGNAGTEKKRFEGTIRGDQTLMMFVAEKRMALQLLNPNAKPSR